MKKTLLTFACLLALTAHAQKEPIRVIGIYVTPFYANDIGKVPQVNTGLPAFDKLLVSDKREDILKVRDAIMADNARISPITMMILANRLYDVGERDEAVFWHYAAKNRFFTVVNSVDTAASGLQQTRDAMSSFVQLAGPFINSYVFCDRAKQPPIAKRAIDWVEQNPYEIIMHPQMVHLAGDPQENIKKTIAALRETQVKEEAMINDPVEWENLQKLRRERHVDEQFCWK